MNSKRLSLPALCAACLSLVTGCSTSKSVGIIGGADGPTAIFVTSSPVDPALLWIAAAALLLLLILAVFIVLKVLRAKKKK